MREDNIPWRFCEFLDHNTRTLFLGYNPVGLGFCTVESPVEGLDRGLGLITQSHPWHPTRQDLGPNHHILNTSSLTLHASLRCCLERYKVSRSIFIRN
jgi:hypothetical protein